MNTSAHDADDAFQAIYRAERWRATAVAAAEPTGSAPAAAVPASPLERAWNVVRRRPPRPTPRFG